MCIACEQNFGWLAYLESRGLGAPAKPAGAQTPSAAVADNPLSMPNEPSAPAPAKLPPFSRDEPTAA